MSYFVDTSETVRVPLDDGQWVELRKRLNFGQQEALTAKQFKVTTHPQSGRLMPVFDVENVNLATLEAYILDWSFTDGSGPVLPSPEAIKRLDPTIAQRILTAIAARLPDRPVTAVLVGQA